MAQAIHCDGEGHLDVLADVMVSNLANGDTSAWCFPHYVDVSRSLVESYDSAVAEAEAAEVLKRLEGVEPPEGSDQATEAGDDAGQATVPGSLDTSAFGPGDIVGPDESEPAPAAPDLGVANFREEGDEPLQDRLGGPETGATDETGPEPTAVENGAPGQPDAATDDAATPGGEPAEADARA